MGLLSINSNIIDIVEKEFASYYTSPYTVMSYLKDRGQSITSSDFIKWDAFARTDVVETTDPRELLILNDGGATAPMIRFDGDFNRVKYLKAD